jgi:hypothetical protein
MFRNLIVIYIFLSSATFFRFTYLPKNLVLLASFGAIILMVAGIVVDLIYYRGKRFPQKFGTEVGILLLAVLLSVFGAKWGHGQSFFLTFWVLTPMYSYFFYYFLHSIRMDPKELEKLIMYMGVAFIGLFYIQYVLYPTMLFGVRAQEARGTIRIFIPGGAFAVYVYFLFLQKSFTTGNKAYLIFNLMYLTVPILQGTRSSISTLLLGTVIFILFSTKVKSKLAVVTLMGVAGVAMFFMFQDIFMALIEVSNEQANQDEDDVRVRAARFFLTEFYPSALNYFTGNGQSHMMSAYGMKIFYYKVTYGFYKNDLGIIGEFVKYGVVFIIGIILTFRKFFVLKIESKYGFLKFWVLLLVLSEALGGMFQRPTVIIVITSVMYIFDVSNYQLKVKQIEARKKKKELDLLQINEST